MRAALPARLGQEKRDETQAPKLRTAEEILNQGQDVKWK
jgi:hypothetical protein